MNGVLSILSVSLALAGYSSDCCGEGLNSQDPAATNRESAIKGDNFTSRRGKQEERIVPKVKAKLKGAGMEWERLNAEVLGLTNTGDYERALSVAEKALDVAKQTAGSAHPDVAVALNNLALVHSKKE